MPMTSEADQDDICKLLQIGNSFPLSKREAAYKKIAKLCFLWAKIEMGNVQASDESSLHSAEDWIVKAFLCYGKASKEFDELDVDDWADLYESVTEIDEWIVDNNDPSFLKAVFKNLDEGPPCAVSFIASDRLASLIDRKVNAVMRQYGERFENNDYKACLPWIDQYLEARQRCLNLGKFLPLSQGTIHHSESNHAIAQIYMNTMKTCMDLADVISKSGWAEEEDYNVCLQEWINQSEQQFQYFRDNCNEMSDHWLCSQDLLNAFEARQEDVAELFRKTFKNIMATECPSLSSSQLEKTLSFLPKKKKMQEASTEKENSNKKNGSQRKSTIISWVCSCTAFSTKP